MARKASHKLRWMMATLTGAAAQFFLLGDASDVPAALLDAEMYETANAATSHLYTFAAYLDRFVDLFRIVA